MKIALLTYATRHLKTEQILHGLVGRCAYADLEVVAQPFLPRPQRDIAFQHRPEMSSGAHPADLCRAYGIPYREIDSVETGMPPCDILVVAGAGLLPPSVVRSVKVVNAHPGLIPAVRGLDAFKWAIHDDRPLGNTLHLLDESVDGGEIIAWRTTPVFADDSPDSLARRHYAIEIAMMTSFLELLESPMAPPALPVRPARKRMPKSTEEAMLAGFSGYVRRHAVMQANHALIGGVR